MYTRKQRWRRTRTRKQAWGDLPPELLDAMLAAGGGGMPKSVSWDHSYAAGLKIRADRAAEVAHRAAAEDSKLKAAAAAAVASAAAKGKGVEVSIPRSVSCSSLGPKRTLFARTSSSKDELGAAGGGVRRGSSATTAAQHRRRMLPHRRGVSFNTQVKMVLIPKREEFSEVERVKLWWGREDYSQFRQVLIDWKRANAHRISHSDNILSINLSDIDEEEESANGQDHSPAAAAAAGSRYTRDHEEAAAAAEATAQAAAAAKAAAEAAAAAAAAEATTRAATAQATAAAAAAATAAEVAALNAEEMERERRRQALAPPPPPQQQQQLEDVVQQAGAGQGNESGGADAWEVEVAVARAMAAAVAAAGGGIAGGAVPELSAAAAAAAADDDDDDDGDGDGLGDVPEGTDEGQKEEARIGEEVVGGGDGKQRRPCARASFSVGGSGLAGGGGGPDWSPNGGANGTFPLRRALTFGEVGGGHSPCSPADSGGGRLREVPLSEAQAMAESLRAWRQSFDVRNAFFGESGDGDAEEDRGRAVSLQVQSRSFARRGRATALVTSRTKWTSDVVGGGEGSSSVEAKDLGLEPGGRSGGEEGSGAMAGGGGAASDGSSSGGGCADRGQRQDGVGEKTHRTLSDQEWSSSRRIVEMAASEAASLTNPVMAAFERERKEAAARQAEVEDAQAARAAAMVKQAAAAAAKAGNGEAVPAAGPGAAGAAEDDGELHVGSVVRLGLNDAPGSASAASAAGLRIAAEGISNLSLRSRDSVENLQERGEQSWGPLPLSSSA